MRSTLVAIAFAAFTLAGAHRASADDSRWGAIAWSPSTGAVGTAAGQIGQGVAQSMAEQDCAAATSYQTTDCETLVVEVDRYAAIAVGRGGATTESGSDWATLRDSVLADCRASYGDRAGCRIASWVYR
jgi:hypothetical protein